MHMCRLALHTGTRLIVIGSNSRLISCNRRGHYSQLPNGWVLKKQKQNHLNVFVIQKFQFDTRKKPLSLRRRIYTHYKHFEDNPACCLVFFLTYVSYAKCMYYTYVAKR